MREQRERESKERVSEREREQTERESRESKERVSESEREREREQREREHRETEGVTMKIREAERRSARGGCHEESYVHLHDDDTTKHVKQDEVSKQDEDDGEGATGCQALSFLLLSCLHSFVV